jgi:NAD-dependent SIR2 family protein deacetylase
MTQEHALRRAAEAIASAEALLIGAGAGMGVDSGLPDFRGNQGFWRTYPPYAKLGLSFASVANPRWFVADPELAWGFYGHRLNLYRETPPHAGFDILRRWAKRMPHDCFVFTSNVDGHFQRAGFGPQQVVEIHGTIHWLQCGQACGTDSFASASCGVEVDESTMRARPPLPACPSCGALARPNILMFGDWEWDDTKTSQQHRLLEAWLAEVRGSRCVVVECGAGTAIPTVRGFCERTAESLGAPLIRINAREAAAQQGHISLPLGALDALGKVDRLLGGAAGF